MGPEWAPDRSLYGPLGSPVYLESSWSTLCRLAGFGMNMFLRFQPSEMPCNDLDGPWGVVGELGAPPRHSVTFFGDHFMGSSGIQLAEKILGWFVITCGVPCALSVALGRDRH